MKALPSPSSTEFDAINIPEFIARLRAAGHTRMSMLLTTQGMSRAFHVHVDDILDRGYVKLFTPHGERIGLDLRTFTLAGCTTHASSDPVRWFRLVPTADQSQTITLTTAASVD